MMKPLLIGEANPYGSDPRYARYALYPYPSHSAGARLCTWILGMETRDYLRAFERRNLCLLEWDAKGAKDEAHSLLTLYGPGSVFILLGKKVAGAFAAAVGLHRGELVPFARVEFGR